MRDGSSTWQFLTGILLGEAGIALIGFARWDPMNLGANTPFYAGGFLGVALGMFLIWKEPLGALMVEGERSPDGTTLKTKVTSLGRIDLNGCSFEAYEEQTDHDSRRFRLRSFPALCPEREAGFIRYLLHEGFIEQRWPNLNEKIEKEAGWAFLL